MSLLHTLRSMALTAMIIAALFTLYILLVELPARTSSERVTYRLPIATTVHDNTDPTNMRNSIKMGSSNIPIAEIGPPGALARIGTDSEKLATVSGHKSVPLSSDQWVSWQDMDQVRYLTLLTAASIASSVICHPLHVIMMRQQVGAMKASGGLRGVYRSLQEAIASIGLRGLFRGWVPLMLEAPSHALYFSVTESSREILQRTLRQPLSLPSFAAETATTTDVGVGVPPVATFVLPTVMVDIIQSLLSALVANAISLIPWVPAEILSAKLAIQSGNAGTAMGMTGMIQHIWRAEGLAGFFKGFGSSLACHVTYSFLWWASYSTTRRQVAHLFPSLPANHTILYDAVTGILAGVASGVINHPLDTIKLRIQTGYGEHSGHDRVKSLLDLEHAVSSPSSPGSSPWSDATEGVVATATNSIFSVARSIVLKEGPMALFHGVSSMVYSTIFSSAAFCIIYEMIKRDSSLAPASPVISDGSQSNSPVN